MPMSFIDAMSAGVQPSIRCVSEPNRDEDENAVMPSYGSRCSFGVEFLPSERDKRRVEA